MSGTKKASYSRLQSHRARQPFSAMMVTIEVQTEIDGMVAMKRSVIRADQFSNEKEIETAAVSFIREAKRANEKELQDASAHPARS